MEFEYLAKNAMFFDCEDTFDNGVTSCWDQSLNLNADSLDELFCKIKSKLCMDDTSFTWWVDYESSSIRCDYLTNGDHEGMASEYEISQWKLGKLRLWNVAVSIKVEKVPKQRNIEVNELKEFLTRNNLLEY